MPELRSTYLFTMSVTVDRLVDVGQAPGGTRLVDLLGPGSFAGPRLRGTVLGGGMDRKLLRADGAMAPNVRLLLRTDDDAYIYMHYTGIRHGPAEAMQRIASGEFVDPSEYYLRNTPYFETAAARYDWLNRICAVGVGRRMPDCAEYDVFEIL